jgi:sugar phosphate isomerase/epimerase
MTKGAPPVYISALHYDWRDLPEAFERATGEFGLDGIEFSVGEGRALPLITPEHGPEVVRLAQQYGAVLSAHVWGDLARMTQELGRVQLREWLGWADAMRMTHIVVHGGSHDEPDVGLEHVTRMVEAAAPDYERAGVVLCLENHYAWDYHDSHELLSTAEEFLAVFERVPSPAVGFCLDYGHSHMNGDTLELLERLADRLVYTHLADNMGVDDDHVAFGAGTIDWARELEATRRVGFAGPFVVEFPVCRPERRPLDECLALIRDVYGQW